MINTDEQHALFTLIANYITQDITCVAIGGTAMMFLGYKNTTKYIDLIFQSKEARDKFCNAIEELGYVQKSLSGIYEKNRLEQNNKPLLYTRGDERFDLFVQTVFGMPVSFEYDSLAQRHDYIQKNELIVHVLGNEDLILLKAITGRDRDFEDIVAIVQEQKIINWNKIVQKVISQAENKWILLILEETLQNLKEYTFIKDNVFQAIYKGYEQK